VYKYTVKSVLFPCTLFCEFCDLGDITKIKDREYSTSDAISVYYFVQEAKMPKLRAPKYVTDRIAKK